MPVIDIRTKQTPEGEVTSFSYYRRCGQIDFRISDNGLATEDFLFLEKFIEDLKKIHINNMIAGRG